VESLGNNSWPEEGRKPPKGSHLGFVQISRGSIFSPTDTKRVFEVRAHYFGQISGLSEEFSHQGKHSNLVVVFM
jgi:hypothetical protein